MPRGSQNTIKTYNISYLLRFARPQLDILEVEGLISLQEDQLSFSSGEDRQGGADASNLSFRRQKTTRKHPDSDKEEGRPTKSRKTENARMGQQTAPESSTCQQPVSPKYFLDSKLANFRPRRQSQPKILQL